MITQNTRCLSANRLCGKLHTWLLW